METHSILLKEDNYAEWSAWMKSYLDRQGLWSIVTSPEASGQEDSKDKNLRALHMIWNSCGEKAFSVAKAPMSANRVWNRLEEKFAMLDSISKDNFLDWSARMKSYLVARDLWSVVDPRQEDNEFSSKNWNIKNLEALQAIRRFCDWEALSKTSMCHTARDAWNVLVNNYDVEDGIKADGDNYADWSNKVKSNLMGQGLWNVIEPTYSILDVFLGRGKKNVKALKVIQSSCGWEAYSHITDITFAQRAWDILGEKYGMRERIDEGKDLVVAVKKGDWPAVDEYLRQHPLHKRQKITSQEETALHIAVDAGQTRIVEKLVERMFKLDLYIVDIEGQTALAHATILGNRQMAECILKKVEDLISVEDKNRRIPVVLAIEYKHKDLALDLYNLTPREVLKQGKGIHGATVCTGAIDNELLDIALDLIQCHPPLALAVDLDQRSPFYALASQRNTFSRLKWVALSKRRICFVHYFCNSFNHSGVKDSEERNSLGKAQKLLQCVCKQISISSYEDMATGGVSSAVNLAIREGKFEFIDEIVKSNGAIKWRDNGNGRTILAIAILHRQANIYRHLLNSLVKDPMINSLDYEKNNILHIAGMLPLSTQLEFIASAAMQMQYELRWFKEVKKIVSPTLEKAKNKDGLTPHELFTEEHNELREKGEKWMKDTATSCTVVGALIITIMFAAAFTVPGGYQQETGFPIFLNKKLFKVFMICDCISLLSSSTSVLMFLAILTSRYAEKDFLIYLPIKMIIGLATLFLSIATMMIAFCAALVLMMRGQASIFISIVCVASLPVAFFVLMQSRLLIDVARSTFASNIYK